jgi:hypothetical protein
VSPGSGTVNARVLFGDGSAQQATPRAIIVAQLAPPSGAVVAEGSVDLEPSAAASRYIPFALPQDANQIDMTVDWTSVLNTVGFVLYQGNCSGNSFCGGLQLIPLPEVTGVKPLRKSTRNLSAGPYSIRIDNVGPGAETVRYEVRLTPK